jgi:hypothetical protein
MSVGSRKVTGTNRNALERLEYFLAPDALDKHDRQCA